MTRFIFICGALMVIFAGLAFGEGAYQRTKDSKTTVWNDDPKPGDAATWFGDRDKDGYAAGVGTLTWHTGDGAVFARYHGNMVRGKFDGMVNAHSKGKTGHAAFVDGKRTSGWAAGRAPSRSEREWRLTAKAKAENVQHSTSNAQRPTAETRAEPRAPEEQAKEENEPAEKRDLAKQENAQRPTPNAQLPMPEKGDTPAEGPTTQNKSQKSEVGSQTSVATASPSVGGSELRGQPPARQSRYGGGAKSVANASRPTITIQDKPEVADFAGPPSALRTNSVIEAPSAGTEPEIASPPSANAQLTPQEAMTLADAEARGQGYDLKEYQRPKADYSAVKGKWSFVYDLKEDDPADANASHFTVTVDDETKKVETRK